ncbi:hypothetical protein GCM10011316_29840 [Roseibium aquae]|uniref:Uncharacterized protein n=1 Tax=Roseibium aquae TaxID=1323746 RepID=A0A916X2L6_9HYPH|nr:hypothetical protein [Roseibium aquae]GGB55785.1 hypothetical protein GCM10011316_29840 [Roseibium aquae]
MKYLLILPLLVACSPVEAEMPTACELLRGVDPEALLGQPAEIVEMSNIDNDAVHMTMCNANPAEGYEGLGVLLRHVKTDDGMTPQARIEAYVEDLKTTMTADVAVEQVDGVGDAGGIWMDMGAQLAFFHGPSLIIATASGSTPKDTARMMAERIDAQLD